MGIAAITPVSNGSTIQEQLGITDRYSYYTGITVQNLQKAAGSLSQEVGLSVTGWDFGSSSTPRYHSVAFFPEQGALLISDELGGALTASGFATDVTLYTLFGSNSERITEGLFYAEDVSPELRKGKFAGTGAETIFSVYERSFNSDQFSSAVAVARRTASTDNINDYTVLDLVGQTVGVVFSESGAAMIPQNETSNTFTVTGNSDFHLNFQEVKGGSSVGPIPVYDTRVEVFISKDAFFTNLNGSSRTLENYLSISSIEDENSYLAGVPGLNDMKYVGWGLWAVQQSESPRQRLFGYTSFGSSSNYTSISDLDALIGNGASNVVTYTGPAMGSVFNSGEQPTIQFGTTSLNVDFGNGAMTGEVGLGSDKIQMIRSAASLSYSFQGSSTLNNSGSGFFRGQFYGVQAAEAGGNFSASSDNRHAIGVFGLKKLVSHDD
ncbi:MAG: hypothetical protein ACI9S8_002384 [Chlamydiales bacterium]